MLRLPRYTGFEIWGSPNHTIEQRASHGALHRRFDGLNGIWPLLGPWDLKKGFCWVFWCAGDSHVGASLSPRASTLGCPRLVGFMAMDTNAGSWNPKQRRAQQLTTANPYHSFPLQSFEQFIKKVFEFVTYSFGYTFLHFSSSFSKLFWSWKIVIKLLLLSWQMVRRSVLA